MDDYNNLIELLTTTPELALIPIALLVGKVVKTSKVPDKYIPIVVIVVSAILGFLVAGTDSGAAIKGFIAGMVAVAGHQAVVQISKSDTKETPTEGQTSDKEDV